MKNDYYVKRNVSLGIKAIWVLKDTTNPHKLKKMGIKITSLIQVHNGELDPSEAHWISQNATWSQMYQRVEKCKVSKNSILGYKR